MAHRHLILGLLAQTPMTGYEIKKRIGTELKSVANASYGTLYPTLHRLLAEGAVHMEAYPRSNRPPRKVYTLTEHGKQELQQWLREPADADHVRSEFLVKLFLAQDLPAADLKALLCQRLHKTEAQLAELQQAQAGCDGSLPPTQVWVREYMVEMYRTELNWLNRLIAQVEADTHQAEVSPERTPSP